MQRVKIKSFYPDNHFRMSLINFGPISGQSIAVLIGGRFDSLSLGVECSTLPDNRFDTIHVPSLDRGSIVTTAFLGLDGGFSFSSTSIYYELDQTALDNFFVLDSVKFVNDNPEVSGGEWFGRFNLNFHLESTPENTEGISYARSVGIQVPETLNYQNISFLAVTSTSHVLDNCGR